MLGIGYSADKAYVSVTSSFLADTSANRVTPVFLPGNATRFVADTTPPMLDAFELNLTAGSITLHLNEPVLLHTLNVTKLTVLGASTTIALQGPAVTLSGTAGITATDIDRHLTIMLTNSDLNILKGTRHLATSSNTTKLTVEPGFILDMAQNEALGIGGQVPVSPSLYVPDNMPPTLVAFRLNHQTEQLELDFDETINMQQINLTGFTLQDSSQASTDADAKALYRYTLSGGVVVVNSLTSFAVQLSKKDLNTLKRLTGLTTGDLNTYLTVAANTVYDTADNGIAGIVDGDGVMAESVTPETIRPNLVSFGVHMPRSSNIDGIPDGTFTGAPLTLRLRFDETMDVSTLDLTKLVVQGRSADGAQTRSHRLTGGTVRALQDGDEGYTNP